MFRPSAQRLKDLVLRTVRAAKAYSVFVMGETVR
jgi:hypothetical protein